MYIYIYKCIIDIIYQDISRYYIYIYIHILTFFVTRHRHRRRTKSPAKDVALQDSEHLRAAPKMMKRSGYCCPGGTRPDKIGNFSWVNPLISKLT